MLSICDCCSELKQVRLLNSKELEYAFCKDAPYHICEDCMLHLDEVTAILGNINDYFCIVDETGVPILYNDELPF